MSSELQVLSVYDGFFTGGARILHTDVVTGLQETYPQKHTVISIHEEVEREGMIQRQSEDSCFEKLVSAGIAVDSLGRRACKAVTLPDFTALEVATLQRHIDASDIILSLKEQPLGLINLARTVDVPIVVSLHRSDPENQGEALDSLTHAIDLGRIASCICCAESTKEAYQVAGVPESLLTVIDNGIDLEKFTLSSKKRLMIRQELGIGPDIPTVVFAARFDEMKNVPLFLQAAKRYLSIETNAQILMCGAGMSRDNAGLQSLIGDIFGSAPDLKSKIAMLGIRKDMDAIYAASDVVALTSSFGEAYPLCLIEGMACGAVPVTTDIGDTRRIVKGRGIVVDPEPIEIAEAWVEAFERRDDFMAEILSSRSTLDRSKMIMEYGNLITTLTSSQALVTSAA